MDHGQLLPPVVVGWRRRRAPFERGSLPGIALGLRSSEPAPKEIEEKEKLGCAQHEGGDTDEEIHFREGFEELELGEIVIAARLPAQADEVHPEKDAIKTDQRYPEVDLAPALVQHAAKHLREPVIPPREQAKQRHPANHVVKVADDEVGGMEVD